MVENSSNNTDTRVIEDVVDQMLSVEVRVIFEIVNYNFFCTIFALFGILTNNINIIVFYKQGLTSSINISFLSLAISDLCSLITLLWFNVCANPLFKNADDIPMVPSEFVHLTAGFPHACFARITCLITAYITAERCMCITLPLKIKQIITPRRAAYIICFIYILHMTTLVPEYLSLHIDWNLATYNRNKPVFYTASSMSSSLIKFE
ncbi:uncharacterized protein LOC131957098 [Physella acuta]|uniref:uncharacterized protein LOC131957098 n=1 Tax=Physella acuta TaxID=109671 RepID=UPI0027DEA752|nr:uncharacterized protein LOC131957098 [Physella acuta]